MIAKYDFGVVLVVETDSAAGIPGPSNGVAHGHGSIGEGENPCAEEALEEHGHVVGAVPDLRLVDVV